MKPVEGLAAKEGAVFRGRFDSLLCDTGHFSDFSEPCFLCLPYAVGQTLILCFFSHSSHMCGIHTDGRCMLTCVCVHVEAVADMGMILNHSTTLLREQSLLI